jgi:hypothetical protein
MTREARAFDLRWAEYKVIQDKIDRIGDFRFRLRGWIVTLVAAAAGGAFSGKLQSPVFLIGCVAIFAFQRLESTQSRWERALGNRAATIEKELNHSYGAPGIVGVLALAKAAASQRRFGRLLIGDAGMFYGLMYCLAAVGFVGSIGFSQALAGVVELSRKVLAWATSVLAWCQ